jgi:hypothetical protein
VRGWPADRQLASITCCDRPPAGAHLRAGALGG